MPIFMNVTAHLAREGKQSMIIINIFKTRRPLAPPRRAADGLRRLDEGVSIFGQHIIC